MSLSIIFHNILFIMCLVGCLYKVTTTDSDEMVSKTLAGKKSRVQRGTQEAIATRLGYSMIGILITIWLCYLNFYFLHYLQVHRIK